MPRSHDLRYFVLCKIMRIGISASFGRTHDAERSVENEHGLLRSVGVLQGVAERDGTGVFAESASDANHNKIRAHDKKQHLNGVVYPWTRNDSGVVHLEMRFAEEAH